MATDQFGASTEQDIKAGGDGAKSYGWYALNTASADTIDVHTTNAGMLTVDCNAVSSDAYGSQFNSPYIYQLRTGDFDVDIYGSGNENDQYEGFGVCARDTSASAGEDWLKVGYGASTESNFFNYWGNNTNSVYSGDSDSNNYKYLRVTRSGAVFTLYTKATSGDSWTQVAQYTRNDFASEIQVGIIVHTVNTDNNYVAQIDYFNDGTVISGTTCWGHLTGVTETNTRTFLTNWTGTGRVVGSGDSEAILLDTGQYMESETGQLTGVLLFTLGKYVSGYGTITQKYKTGTTQANCEADTWHTYSGSFTSTGYYKLRVEST